MTTSTACRCSACAANGLSRSSDLLKRAVDLVGASLILVLLAPVFAAIAIAIKLDSHGPVFFRQRRIGRSSEGFDMFQVPLDGG